MGRIGIKYQDVATAIATLQAQSKPPTVDNIREVLKTGSKSTIVRLLREWKQQNGLLQNNDGILPNDLLAMIKEFWLNLQPKAEEANNKRLQESDAVFYKIQEQLNHYKAKDMESQRKIQALEEKLYQQNEDNQHLNIAFIAEQQEKIKATERLQTLQSHQLESQSENERLHQLLKHAQANLEHSQTIEQQLQLEHEIILEKQRADYEQKLSQLQQQIELVAREKMFLETDAATLGKDYDLLMAQHTALESQTQEMQKKHSKLELDCARISQNYARMSQDFNVQRQTLEAKNHGLVECQLRLGMAEEHVDYLQNTLFATEDKLIALQDDYLYLSQQKMNLEGQVRQLQATLRTVA
jgi:chromosome segregation ATPase